MSANRRPRLTFTRVVSAAALLGVRVEENPTDTRNERYRVFREDNHGDQAICRTLWDAWQEVCEYVGIYEWP